MYYLDFGDFQIAGASPEPLLPVIGDRVETRPIAGTRPRGANAADDAESPPSCSPTRRSAPSTSCSSTSAATTSAACASTARSRSTSCMKIDTFAT